MPEFPPPRPPSAEPKRRSWFTILLVLLACLMGAAFLLIAPTGFIGPVIVFGGLIFFGVIGLHYLVWGRWMNQLLRDEQADEE